MGIKVKNTTMMMMMKKDSRVKVRKSLKDSRVKARRSLKDSKKTGTKKILTKKTGTKKTLTRKTLTKKTGKVTTKVKVKKVMKEDSTRKKLRSFHKDSKRSTNELLTDFDRFII